MPPAIDVVIWILVGMLACLAVIIVEALGKMGWDMFFKS